MQVFSGEAGTWIHNDLIPKAKILTTTLALAFLS